MPAGKIKTIGRPEKIYLDEPLVIGVIKIGHTREGLEYLIDHYTCTMNQKHLTEKNLQHRQRLIENWTIHLEMYNKKGL